MEEVGKELDSLEQQNTAIACISSDNMNDATLIRHEERSSTTSGIVILRFFLAIVLIFIVHTSLTTIYSVLEDGFRDLQLKSELNQRQISRSHLKSLLDSQNRTLDDFIKSMGSHAEEGLDALKSDYLSPFKEDRGHKSITDDDGPKSVKNEEDERFHITEEAKEKSKSIFKEDPHTSSDSYSALSRTVAHDASMGHFGDEEHAAFPDFANANAIKCTTKKRIILSVNKCGLGNRMVSLVSTVMLALLMDRVIELDWVNNYFCGASYKEIFHSKPQDNLDHGFRPFIYDNDDKIPNSMPIVEKVCRIYFDQTLNYTHLAFINDKVLFDRLNNECKVIHIQANIYFAHFLLANEDLGERLRQTFHETSPFHHISQIAFRPDAQMKEQVSNFIQEKFKGKKWLSIHARGIWDTGTHAEAALECANKLIANGDIAYVFFASDSSRLIARATALIAPENLVAVPHEAISDESGNRIDSFKIRKDGMNAALLEWLLIGEATYCTATEHAKSTYSKTAIVNGPCQFILYSGKSCRFNIFF